MTEFTSGPNLVSFLLSDQSTGGKFSLPEFAAASPPVPTVPPHVHRDSDETLYVLDGQFQFILDGQRIPAPPGSYVFIPNGMRHGVENVGPTPGQMLVILTPPGFEQLWRERAELEAWGERLVVAALLALQAKCHMDADGQVRRLTND